MNPNFANWDDRQLEEAMQAFTEGVDHSDMEALEAELSSDDLEEFEAAIAAIQWTHSDKIEAPPSALMASLKAQAAEWIEQQDDRTDSFEVASPDALPSLPARQTGWLAIAGWAAAAALLVVLFVRDRTPVGGDWNAADRLSALVESAPDLVRIDWSVTADPTAQGVTGEVVWSDAQQEGYMVFSGLPVNDPNQAQYQLWIFDPTRADWEALPVDGGVFDIEAATTVDGQAIVPIRPTLPVKNVALFAITVEQPGGVVVSKRERLVLTASPG